MPDSALYFPYAEPRRDVALNRVLLYWDQLATITPEPWRYQDQSLEDFVDAGLILPIRTREYLDGPGYRDFVAGLEGLLDHVVPGQRPIAPVLIHEEKTDRLIREMFHERGLAARGGRTGEVLVEGNAGALYLAYLAHFLARQPGLDMEPITDQRLLLEVAAGFRSFSVETAIDGARSSALSGVLPAPGEWVSAVDLARFKDQHRDELRALRREVEQSALLCAKEADLEVRRRMERDLAERMRERVETVRARMKERRWPTIDGIVCALVEGAPAIVTGVATHSPGIAATGAGPLIVDYLKANGRARDRDLPATYGVLAQAAFPAEPPARRRRRRGLPGG